ncbi:MAG: hypothetical protein B6I18_07000 [Bacteroidetes bacterium 4572_112]|nr:MAG: hypothetical protein B6I18_07000 [Bacteroidetes bacterium 4572_112]
MNRIIIFILTAVLFLPTLSKGQEVYTLNLQKAVELAKTENKNILNAEMDVVIAKQKVWETTAIGLPQINTELKYSNSVDVPVSLLPAEIFGGPAGTYVPAQFGQQHNSGFTFSASQLLFSGEYIVALQASAAYKEMSVKAALKSENDVIELVTKSYYGVLMAYQNEKILMKTKDDIQKSYDEIQATHAVGLADEIAVDQLEINLLTVNNTLASVKRQKVVAENILKFQIGIDITDSINLTDSLEYIFDNASLKPVMDQEFDITKNIDYQILQNQKEITELSMKREKSTLLPTLNAFYSHNVSGQTNEFGDYFNGNQQYFQSNVIGVGLKWQIWGSGSRYAKIQQAKIEVDKMDNQDYMMEQRLGFQIHQAKTNLINFYETYIKEQKNTELAEKIYHRSMIKFSNGTITSTELTQLNMQYINSQSAYFNAIIQVLNSKAELDKILGNNIKQ